MFEGYAPETLEFLWGIRLNNDRAWFAEHKEEYLRYLYQPTLALGEEVQSAFLAEFPRLQLNLHVCRIYRDARRLRGSGPYKDCLWFTLRREEGVWTEQPVFWFEVGTDCSYGVGFWMASARTMAVMRRDMDADPKRAEKLVRRLARRREFTLQGEEYARPKPAPSPRLASWYNRKSISIGANFPFDGRLYDPALARTLAESFAFLVPYYEYLDGFCKNGLEDLK